MNLTLGALAIAKSIQKIKTKLMLKKEQLVTKC